MKYNDIILHDWAESMINLNNIHSVTDFQRNPKAILAKLRETRSAAVLTVNGRPELVVQDAASYQALIDKVQAAEDMEAIREGLAQSFAGQGRPIADFFAEFESEHGL
jgi:PHD/YefM family antitoxin component YafN of YafNO toxin-antitoxin module